ncbi:MAG TPA: methyltransferase domain-containing protein [Polyangiaceae bacterium]|jgi:SAM-dependent methyltransferase
MSREARDVPAGDVDYARHGQGYAAQRRADPRIFAQIQAAFGAARSVLNVGAGAGSYEPLDRHVIAIEPSAAMRAQRPPHLAPAIDAVAEHLPLDDRSVDASLASITVHQWRELERGLGELRRVTRGNVVVLTFDPDALGDFWLSLYAPELLAAERARLPSIARIVRCLGERVDVQPVTIPSDCCDGFTEAYYARPEVFLESVVRRSQSAWTFLEPGMEEQIVARLRAALESGEWDARFGALRRQPTYQGSLRLIVGS